MQRKTVKLTEQQIGLARLLKMFHQPSIVLHRPFYNLEN